MLDLSVLNAATRWSQTKEFEVAKHSAALLKCFFCFCRHKKSIECVNETKNVKSPLPKSG